MAGLLHDVWLEIPPPKRRGATPRREAARFWAERARAGGYAPLAREFEALCATIDGSSTSGGLVAAYAPPAPWEAALSRLEALAETVASPDVAEPAHELVWQVEMGHFGPVITPRLRGRRAKKGRPVALTRLLEGELHTQLDDADQRVLAAVEFDPYSMRPRPMLGPRALLALVEHPRVVDTAGAPLTVEHGQVHLRARRVGDATRIELEPPELLDSDLAVESKPGRLQIFERSPAVALVADLLQTGKGVAVPSAARDRLGRALTRISVAAGIEVVGDLDTRTLHVDADPRPVLLLVWNGEMLTVRIRVAPLGLDGPHALAGIGSPDLMGSAGGAQLARCSRDLDEERERRHALLEACPTLSSFDTDDGNASITSLVDALSVMLELQACGDSVVLAWPDGRKLQVPTSRDLSELGLTVGRRRDWIGVSVDLKGDEAVVLGFQALLRARRGRALR